MYRTRVALLFTLACLSAGTLTSCSGGSEGPSDLSDVRRNLPGVSATEHEVRLPTGVMHLWISEPGEEVSGSALVNGEAVSGGDGVVVVRWNVEQDVDQPAASALLVGTKPAVTTVEVRSGGEAAGSRETRGTTGGFAVAIADRDDIEVSVGYDGVDQVVDAQGEVDIPARAQPLYDPPGRVVEDASCRSAGRVPGFLTCRYSSFEMPWLPEQGWSGEQPWRIVQLNTPAIEVERQGATYAPGEPETSAQPPMTASYDGAASEATYVFEPGSGGVVIDRSLPMTKVEGAESAPPNFVTRVRLTLDLS